MEDTLRVPGFSVDLFLFPCLNPCFNGRYSQSLILILLIINYYNVLILVLMEDTLRAKNKKYGNKKLES